MAGRGPAPKDPKRRARGNKDPIPTTVLRFEHAEQPALPDVLPSGAGWPVATRRWWSLWGDSPQADHFGSTDWDYLLDTALLHAQLWAADSSAKERVEAVKELRLRVAKFGATMEDRARLRMQFAQADEADAKRPKAPESKARYGDLRVVGGDKAAANG